MKRNYKYYISQIWNCPSRLGEKLGWEWLVYNPGVFLEFALVAKRNAPIFAAAVARAYPEAKTVADVGSGTGTFAKALTREGKMVDAFEYSFVGRTVSRLLGVKASELDVTRKEPVAPPKKYDLAFSLEVGEHIPTPFSGSFVEILCSLSDTIIFTSAQPGQSGHGHINCQTKSFWVDLFQEHGYQVNKEKTPELLSLLEHPRLSSFIRNNLVIYSKEEDVG